MGKEDTVKGIRLYRLAVAVALLIGLTACATSRRADDFTDPGRLQKLVTDQSRPYLLLDVRTPAEFAAGHIPTARNIPYDRIREEMSNVARDSLIIVYCASGSRAAIAAETLADLGYGNVANFGAITSWPGQLVVGGE